VPDDLEVLPTDERLQGCTVAPVSGGIDKQFVSKPKRSEDKKVPPNPPKGVATVQLSYNQLVEERMVELKRCTGKPSCLCDECCPI
jgi:hypothetical protein